MLALGACKQERVVITPVDAAVSSDARDAQARARRGRGRRRGRVVVAGADRGARTGNGPSPANDILGDDPQGGDDEPAPERPRITERGPMLPEDVGSAPSMSMDLTQNNDGPLGIEPSQVSRGMDPLMGRLQVCAAATDAQGRTSVRLRIRNDGTPTAARVSLSGSASSEFVPCVRRVIASARFGRFNGPDALVSWSFSVD